MDKPPVRRKPASRRKIVLDGKYELVQAVGVGGMATVWRGTLRGAAGFKRTVAVKRILPEFRDDKQYVDMFVEEARVGSELVHQNLVQVYDFCGSYEEGYFLVMEWVEGVGLGDLAQSFGDQPSAWDEMAFVVASALNGLAIAHGRIDDSGATSPIIHRDVSPANILVSVRGVAKLGDFGLAKAEDRNIDATAPGILKGKPSYTAPELLRESSPDPLTDIYATGVVLWEVLAGRKLFTADSEINLFRAVMGGEVARLDSLRPDLPPSLVALVHRAIARDPGERPQSASDFADELFSILKADGGSHLKARVGERVRALKA